MTINGFERLETGTRTEIDQWQYMMFERELTSNRHRIRSLHWNQTIWEHRTRNFGQLPFNSLRANNPTHLASSPYKKVRMLKFKNGAQRLLTPISGRLVPRLTHETLLTTEQRWRLSIPVHLLGWFWFKWNVERGGWNESVYQKSLD